MPRRCCTHCALWAVAGAIDEQDLLSYRQFGSRLEGHPTQRFPYAEAATGSLGQGLGIGLGMALNASRLDRLPYRTYVLLGDSEMSEGSQWEAIQLAAHYQLANLVGIIDVNRLGQRGAARTRQVAAGATVHEALKAFDQLRRDGIPTRVIDAYSIKPIDAATLRAAADATGAIVTVEDHYPAGGLGEAVLQALADRPVPVTMLAVHKTPMSGTGEELRDFAGISAASIIQTVRRLVASEGEHAGAAMTGKGGHE